jgi:DNA-binding NtrC family response regulator
VGEEYDVRTAYGGEEALAAIDDDVDVALLDRRMPDLSGDEVLKRIRQRGIDVRVAMVTAVEPDFDIVNMPCQDYLVKSVDREDILDTVERLLRLAEYDQKQRELSSKKVRRNVLEVEKTERELAESEAFQRLERRIDELETELGVISESIDYESIEKRV